MALNQPRPWLIGYDIRDPRRLARVHRFLKRHAVPVQYSLFVRWGSLADAERLAQALRPLIDESCDDVRMYSLPEKPELFSLGGKLLPDDALLLGENSLPGLGNPLARNAPAGTRPDA